MRFPRRSPCCRTELLVGAETDNRFCAFRRSRRVTVLGSPTAAGDGTRGPATARAHRTTVISSDSASCQPLRVVLVEGRDEGNPGGLDDIRGRRPYRNPAARQLHLELDLSDSLAARAD